MERDRRIDNGSFGIRVRDGHKVTAHDDLAITVCHTAVTDLLDRLGLQLLPAVLALPVLAALGIGSGFPVNNPLAGFVAGRLGIVALVDIAAAGTGVDGIAHLRAGGSLHLRSMGASNTQTCCEETSYGIENPTSFSLPLTSPRKPFPSLS